MLDMVKINLKQLIKDEGISALQLSKKTGIVYMTLLRARGTGLIKPCHLSKLKKVYDMGEYIN